MLVVPAVAGRVLRFDGQLQHAVPKPADVWLAPFARSPSGTAEELMRSVVLFNTWDDAPLDVKREERPPPEQHHLDAACCTPRQTWLETAPAAPSTSGDVQTMKLWLLGDERRRGQVDRTLPLRVDGPALIEALEQASKATHLEPLIEAQADASTRRCEKEPRAASRALDLARALQKARCDASAG